MKKFFKTFLIAFLLCIVVCGVLLIIYEQRNIKEEKQSSYHFTKEELALLQDGDIILRKGYGSFSESISRYLNEPYNISHCGIIAIDSNRSINVYHTVSSTLSNFDGMQKATIKEFCRQSKKNSIIVVRFNRNGEKPLSLISKEAIFYFNKKVPFDNSFSLESDDSFYCSELIWKILLQEYNFDLYPNKAGDESIKFSPLYNIAYFDIIINHQQI